MRKALHALAGTITRNDRAMEPVVWSDNSWTHNVFQAWHYLFGYPTQVARDGTVQHIVRASTGFDGEREYGYTLSGWIAVNIESPVRRLLTRWAFSFVPVYLCVPAFAGFGTPLRIPVLLAVAFDNNGAGSLIVSAASGSPNGSLTRVGTYCTLIIVTDSGSTDQGTTAQYGSTTGLITIQKQSSLNFSYLYALKNGPLGANTVKGLSSAADLRLQAVNYSGSDVSGPNLDASTVANNASTASFIPSVTTVTDNAMVIFGGQNNGGAATASVGTMRTSAGTGRMLGDNTTTTHGASTMTMGGVGTAAWGAVCASIAPMPATVTIPRFSPRPAIFKP